MLNLLLYVRDYVCLCIVHRQYEELINMCEGTVEGVHLRRCYSYYFLTFIQHLPCQCHAHNAQIGEMHFLEIK